MAKAIGAQAIGSSIVTYLKAGQGRYGQVFQTALAKVLEFTTDQNLNAPSDPKVSCVMRLLHHFRKAGLCDAFFAYLVRRDGTVESIARHALALGSNLARVDEKLREHHSTGNELANAGNKIEDIQSEIAQLWKGLKLPKTVVLPYKQGVLVRDRTLPLLRHQDSHLIMYFFCEKRDLDPTFLAELFRILLPLWSNAFLARIHSYEHSMEMPDEQDLLKSLHLACGTHAWLMASDICQACERCVSQVQESQKSDGGQVVSGVQKQREDLTATMGRLVKEWHCCLERPWPCDEGRTFDPHVMHWYLWRLLGQENGAEGELNRAVNISMKSIVENLKQVTPPTQLDKLLPMVVLLQILDSIRDKRMRLPKAETEEYLGAKDHLGRFAATILAGMAHTPESIEAMIWALSQYAYQALGVDRRLHLASHMRHGARGEPSLHMMREFYRDHFFHTLEVCSLGHMISMARPDSAKAKPAFPSDTDFLREWYIAALLHDIGYAVDICKGLKDWLTFFASDSFSALGGRIAGAVASMATDVKGFYEKFGFVEKDKPWEDHGLVGAHHLQTLVDDLKAKDCMHTTDHAVQAIAKHNCQNIRINYHDEKLSALLVLCDLLQAWRRPQFTHFAIGPAWMMTLLTNRKQRPIHPDVTSASLLSNLRFSACDKRVTPCFTPPLVLRLEYGPEVNRDSYVFNIWLDATCNLQRVDFTKLPYDVLVQIVTPTYSPPGSQRRLKQMDRLRDAAWETHMAYLARWFPVPEQEKSGIPKVDAKMAGSCCADQRVCYHVEYDTTGKVKVPVREMLSFSLRKMNGEQDLVTEGLSRFRADLRGWKNYQQDRLIMGDYSPWRHNQ